MATDFFERQAAARRTTKWLVAAFALAVVLLVGTTMVVAAVAVDYGREYHPSLAFDQRGHEASYEWQIPLWAGAGSLALIGGGTLFKIAQLAGGGTVMAERLGGRRVYPNMADPTERRLLNVVEEMALASGVPVPPVFLLNEERGLNAFAAGFSPSDAVIGVTRGAAEQLSRDELQGVIAHEFSHILNGDMRLNLRLIGVLHGILLLGLVGRELLRVVARGGGGSRSRKNNGILILLAIGVALVILGFLGSMIGNLIKAAVSRQREFLADASAVQFTRNPGGIAGALKRIGGAIFGSRLLAPAAAEASHMYFSQGVWEGISGMMATHPPLPERIRRLDPQWDGTYPPPLPSDFDAGRAYAATTNLVGAGDATVAARRREEILERVGRLEAPSDAHRRYVAELVSAMPPRLVQAIHEPYGARAAIYATLLDRDADIRTAQLHGLENVSEPQVFELTLHLAKEASQLDVRARLPLLDMAMPALRAMSSSQCQDFVVCVRALIEADNQISLFEWMLQKVLLRHLRPQFEPVKRPMVAYYGLQRLAEPIGILLSALARASQADDQRAFNAGSQHFPELTLGFSMAAGSGLTQLNAALDKLVNVAPRQRNRLVAACASTICVDATVTVEEGELLRAVCDMLDCPMPPLVAGQSVSRRIWNDKTIQADAN